MKPPSKITRKSSTQSSLNPSKSVPSGKLRVCELENGRWPSRNRRFSRENSMVGLSIVFSDCRNQRVKNPFSYGFPLVFLWFSHGFPMVFLWFSYGFPMVFHTSLIFSIVRCFGVEVNARSRLGKLTPLHVAAAQGSVDLVEHLLAAHADVLCQTEDGEMGHGIFPWDIKGYADYIYIYIYTYIQYTVYHIYYNTQYKHVYV